MEKRRALASYTTSIEPKTVLGNCEADNTSLVVNFSL